MITSVITITAVMYVAFGERDKVCLPANVCEVEKRPNQAWSRQYLCQEDGTVCQAVYDNDDCSGDYTSCESDTEEGTIDIVDCNGCQDYMILRYYDINSNDTECLNKDYYYQSVLMIGCFDPRDFGVNSTWSAHYTCTDTTRTLTYYGVNQCDGTPGDITTGGGECKVSEDTVELTEVLCCGDCDTTLSISTSTNIPDNSQAYKLSVCFVAFFLFGLFVSL